MAEGRHHPGSEPWWGETWCFEAVQAEVAALTCLTLIPHQRRAWYWSVVIRPDEPLIHVADLTVGFPARGLEIRGAELWADHIVEEPGERWTIGNEANAIALDDSADAFGTGYGTPTPLGIDAEWERVAEPRVSATGHEVTASVHGDLLIGTRRIELDCGGRWWHRWGSLQVANVARPAHPWAGVLLEFGGPPVEHVMWLANDGWHHPNGSLSPP